MLDQLLAFLENGPLHTKMMTAAGNAQTSLKVVILSADQVGIVCQPKGPLGGIGAARLHPWSSIVFIDLPQQ